MSKILNNSPNSGGAIKDIIRPPKGVIKLVLRDKETKKVAKVIDTENVITYTGATILAHALAGDRDYRITHIYGEHVAPGGGYLEGELNGMVESKNDDIDTMRTPPRTTVDAESPLIFANYYTSDTQYNNNVVTFTASWNSVNLVGRLMQGAGLVTQFKSAEYLFAHAYFPAVAMQPGQELLCHWSEIFV